MAKVITLESGELQALIQILDLGVKAGGLSVARAAAHIVNLIEAAPETVDEAPASAQGSAAQKTEE